MVVSRTLWYALVLQFAVFVHRMPDMIGVKMVLRNDDVKHLESERGYRIVHLFRQPLRPWSAFSAFRTTRPLASLRSHRACVTISSTLDSSP